MTDHQPARPHQPDFEELLTSLAARQHGVVSRAQLLAAGVSPDVVDRRLKSRRLQPMHRGVYLVGPLRAPLAREMAAVLVCGGGVVVSHWSAAPPWQLLPAGGGIGPVEVTTTRGDHGRRPGLRVHRVRALPPDEVTILDGIPTTTAARTLLDLAGVAQPRELERALAQALRSGLASRSQLLSLVARHARRRGAARLRALVAGGDDVALTRSEAEERLLALIRKARLPAPAVNTMVSGYEVDFYWREQRFAVEVDGFAFHSSAGKFESDRRRDAELAAAGVHVIRLTWRQLAREPEAALIRLARARART